MPTPVQYTYTISTAIPAGKVALDRLKQEIDTSAIAVALDLGNYRIDGDTLTIGFLDTPISSHKLLLDGSATGAAASPATGTSILATHSGEELPDQTLYARRQSDGAMVVTVESATTATNIQVVGHRYEAELDSSTLFVETYAELREIQGVEVDIKDFTDGDRLQLFVSAPVLGPPEDEASWAYVRQYAKNIYVPPDGRIHVVSMSSAYLPAGLRLVLVYESVAVSGPKPVVYALYHTWVDQSAGLPS